MPLCHLFGYPRAISFRLYYFCLKSVKTVKSNFSPQTMKWCFAAIVVLSVSLQWYGHRCGMLLTPDSENYISASKSVKTDGSFLSPDGSLYTYWPPLFPATLSVFNSPEQAVPWMYSIVTILIGMVSVLILNPLLQNHVSKVIVFFLTLTSVQFMMISVFLWSEMNFLLLVLCVTYCSLNLKKSSKYFTALLVFAFLMCLQRNAGVFILAGVCCWILLDGTYPFKERAGTSAVTFIVGISGLVAWNIYLSVGIESGFFFYKHEFFIHAIENFITVSAMLVRIFIPVSGWAASVIGIAMMIVLIFQISRSAPAIQLIGLLIMFYWLGLVCMFRLDIYDMDRFLSPIVFFLYLIVFERLEKVLPPLRQSRRLVWVIILLLWMVYPVYRTVTNLQQWNTASCKTAY